MLPALKDVPPSHVSDKFKIPQSTLPQAGIARQPAAQQRRTSRSYMLLWTPCHSASSCWRLESSSTRRSIRALEGGSWDALQGPHVSL